MEDRRRKEFFISLVLVSLLSSASASGVGPGVKPYFTVPKQVLIEGKAKTEFSPHVSTSSIFLSQAVTSKHNDIPATYTLGKQHEAMSDWVSFQSEAGPVKDITTGHVNEGQTTLLQMTDEAKKKYWFQEEVKVHMVPNLDAYLSDLENYNRRHCPGSCVIPKFYDCNSGAFWFDKGGCTAPQACCPGEVSDKALQDSRVCSGKCFNEELGKCAGVTEPPVKSKSCSDDAPLCCTIRGTLIPFVPAPSPAPAPPPGQNAPAPVDTFRGTKPRSGSNIDKSLQPPVQLNANAFTGLKAKVAQLYNYFGGYISTKAAQLAIKPHVLGGVLHILSKGLYAFNDKGRMQILFNADLFWDNWGQWHEDKFSRHYGFNHKFPYKGQTCRVMTLGPWKKCHKDQEMEWEMLRFAQNQNNYQALRSVSMGVTRVRGHMFAAANYRSPVDMFLALSESARAQLDAFSSVISNPKFAWCLLGLRTEKLGMFANCFNGKNGRHGRRYVSRMKEAIKAYIDVTDVAD